MDVLKHTLKGFREDVIDGTKTITGYTESEEGFKRFLDQLLSLEMAYAIRSSKIVNDPKDALFYTHSRVHHDAVHGYPFILHKNIHMKCVHAEKYYRSKTNNLNQDPPAGKRMRVHVPISKKLGCKSFLLANACLVFKDERFCIEEKASQLQTRKARTEAICELRKAFSTPEKPAEEIWFFISLKLDHNHELSAQNFYIHPELKKKIEELVHSGVTSTPTIKMHLNELVGKLFEGLSLPKPSNAAFFPSNSVIYTHVYNILASIKYSTIDQEELQVKIKLWMKDDPQAGFFFRPICKESIDKENGGESLLFCHQTKWQQQLLETYGETVYFGTFNKASKYSLPLFFLVVKTHSEYMVVGTFVCQNEETNSIVEALQVFNSWNENWLPLFFVTDLNEAEINAVENVFPMTKVVICPFLREQSWLKWVKKRGNIVLGRPCEVLSLFRKFLKIKDEEELDQLLNELMYCDLWTKNEKVIEYFNTVWLPHKDRWVPCWTGRSSDYGIKLVNGVEVQNRNLKKYFLSGDRSLTDTLTIIVEKFLTDMTENPICKTLKPSSESETLYSSEIPDYLHYRPSSFIEHVMDRLSSAVTELTQDDVEEIADGVLQVRSSDSISVYDVNFNDATCTCLDFQTNLEICKHFCACISFHPHYCFDRLPESYRNDPARIAVYETHDLLTPTNDTCSGSVELEKTVINVVCIEETTKQRLVRLRELLKSAIDSTYDVGEGDYLDSVTEKAMDIVNILKSKRKSKVKNTDDTTTTPVPTKKLKVDQNR